MDTAAPARPRRIRLEGRTALVLGAVGEFGRAAATTLAALGARVVVADDDRTALEREYGNDERFEVSPATTSSAEGLAALATSLPEIDVLIHRSRGSAEGSGRNRAGSGLDTIRHFVPAMAQRRRGSIIAFGCWSTHSARERGVPGIAGEGFHQEVRGLAGELRPFGVRVNALAPDGIEPTTAVAFLASDSSAHVTGALLAMERGWSTLERLDSRPSGTVSLRHLEAVLAAGGRDRGSYPGLTVLPSLPHVNEPTMSEEVYERRLA